MKEKIRNKWGVSQFILLFQKFKYQRKESEKATVTILDETDDKDKEIDLSIHAGTAKTVPVQDENPRKRTISQANLEGNCYFLYCLFHYEK